MNKRNLLVLLTFISFGLFANEYNEKWYDEVSEGTGIDIEKDSNGDYYRVLNRDNGSNSDILLVKYDHTGAILWSDTFDDGGDDFAIGIDIDASDNIYIVGNSDVGGTTSKATVLQYDTDGNFNWEANYGGIAGSEASDFFLNGSYMHVTGFYKTSATNTNLFVSKYSDTGSTEWAYTYDNDNYDRGNAIFVRSTGDVFVGGETSTSNTTSTPNSLVLKISSAGSLTWEKSVTNCKVYDIIAFGFGVNFAVYAVGEDEYYDRPFFIKYSNTGLVSWNNTYTIESYDYFYDQIANLSGSIYIQRNSTTKTLVKYDTSGNQLWESDDNIHITNQNHPYALIDSYIFCSGRKYDVTDGTSSFAYNNGYTSGVIQGVNYDIFISSGYCYCIPQASAEISLITGAACSGQEVSLEADTVGECSIYWGFDHTGCSASVSNVSSYTNTSITANFTACYNWEATLEAQDQYACPMVVSPAHFQVWAVPGSAMDTLQYRTSLEICEGGTVDFTVKWYDFWLVNESTGDIAGYSPNEWVTVSDTGRYYAVRFAYNDDGYCADTSEIEVVSYVTETPPVFIGADLGGGFVSYGDDTTFCDNEINYLYGNLEGNYLWSTGDTTNRITISTGGTYTVSVSYPGCNTVTDEILINNYINTKPNLGPDTVICYGNSITYNVESGHVNYEWRAKNYPYTSGSDVTSFTVDKPGYVTVSIEKANGCIAKDTVYVHTQFGSSFSISDDSEICAGTTVDLEVDTFYINTDEFDFYEDVVSHDYTTSGDAGYYYAQSSYTNYMGDTAVKVGGMYESVGSLQITVNVEANTDIVKLNLLGTVGSTSTLEIDGITFTSEEKIIEQGDAPDYYCYTFEGVSAITSDGEVVINFEDADYSSYNGGLTLLHLWVTCKTTSNFTSLWTSNPSGTNETTTAISVSPNYTTEYYYTMDDGYCSVTDTVKIDVNSVYLGEDIVECYATTTTLDAGEGFDSYSWSTGETSQTIDVTANGTYSVTVSHSSCPNSSDDIQVTFNAATAPDLGGDYTACEGTSITLDAGAGFSSYLWSNGETTQTITVTESANYIVSVSNGACAPISDTSFVSFTSPSINLGSNVEVCEGESVSLDAGTAVSYEWSTTETSQTISPTSSGTYSVTISDANGCENSDDILVTFNPLPNIELGNNIETCDGQAVTLNAGSAESYEWSTTETSQTISPTSTGTYYVTIIDANGCENSDNITVTFNTLPTVNLGDDVESCEGETVTLDAGSGFESYEWFDGEDTQTISPTSSGDYIVTVTDANGCENTDIIFVTFYPIPTVDLGEDFTSCTGSTVTLDAGSGADSYEWGDGEDTQTIDVTSAASYYVTVTTNGCSASDEITVSFDANISINLGDDIVMCQGDVANLNAGSGFDTYTWSNGESSQSINVNTEGTYAVEVSSGACPSVSDTIEVIVNSLPIVNLGSDTAICENAILLLEAGTFDHYLWNNMSSNSTLIVSTAGTYFVEVTDENACSNSDTINISINSLPVVNLGNDTTICSGASLLLDAGTFDNYLWNDNSFGATLIVTETGIYSVEVTDANACTNSDTINVIVDICAGIAENGLAYSMHVFPNPANDYINIVSENTIIKTIQVVSISGKIYKQLNVSDSNININIENLEKGVYFLKIETSDSFNILKFVKQ
ncbi:MAG: T9SS type A sorting domain-containing protein [Bacteroidales bacterium]|nr:T9SS type A sorting domain-containing protein [Bacteroidales bacterium]